MCTVWEGYTGRPLSGPDRLLAEAARSLSVVMDTLIALQYESSFCHEREEHSCDFRTISVFFSLFCALLFMFFGTAPFLRRSGP